MWIHGSVSLPPASSSRTRLLGSALSRLASTQPAEPAPTMTKYTSAVASTWLPPLVVPRHHDGAKPARRPEAADCADWRCAVCATRRDAIAGGSQACLLYTSDAADDLL